MQEAVLISYAILNTNWQERRKSYIDNFVPFVADCLRIAASPEVSTPNVQTCIHERFGLDIPQHVIETILDRAKKEGVVDYSNGILVRQDAVVAKYNLEPRRADAIRRQEAVQRALGDYVADEYGLDWSQEAAGVSLFSYLERRSLPVVRQVLRGGTTPSLAPNITDPEQDYIVASFVTHVCESDPDVFSHLVTIIKGSMLATALYLPSPGSMGGRIRNLRVVLDTPFLLRALGYQGETQAEAGGELLDMLRRLGAQLACLPATLQEMRGVLAGCSAQLRALRRKGDVPSGVLDYCIRNGLTSADVDVIRDRVEQDLVGIGVVVRDAPPITRALAVDEDALDAILQDRVGYQRKQAREHDLNALTAIYRLRRGREQRNLEDARAIFVTTNGRLVGAARDFFGEPPRGDHVPIATLDHELGTVVWLKSPLKAPEFPRKLILADAYAALSPSDEMWAKYLDAIDRMSESNALNDEDYAVLRYSVEGQRALMRETRGDPRAFTTGTVYEVLAEAKRQAAEEYRLALEQARGEAASERARREHLEIESRASQQELERQRQLSRQREAAFKRIQSRKVDAFAEKTAAFIAKGSFVLLALACLVGLGISLPRPFPNLIKGLPRIAALVVEIIGLIGLAVMFSSALSGETASSVATRFQESLSRRLKPALQRWFGPD